MNTEKIEKIIENLKDSEIPILGINDIRPVLKSWLKMYRSLLREDLLHRCTRGEEYVPDHIKNAIKSAEDALGKL